MSMFSRFKFRDEPVVWGDLDAEVLYRLDDLDAQVAQIGEQVEDAPQVSADLLTLERAVDDLRDEIEALKAEIRALQEDSAA